MRPSHFLAVALALALSGPAAAATVTFDVTVTSSTDNDDGSLPLPVFDVPDLGAMGQVTIDLPTVDLGDATPLPDFPDGNGTFIPGTASVQIGDLSGALEPGIGGLVFFDDGAIRLANGDFSAIAVTFPTPNAPPSFTFAGSFIVTAPATGSGPTTLGDIAAILLDPAAAVRFSFNGTTYDGIDTGLVAEGGPSVPPIPLPAAGWTLLGGLGMLGLMRRRRTPLG